MPSIEGTARALTLIILVAACGSPSPTSSEPPSSTVPPTIVPSGQPTQSSQPTISAAPTSTDAATPTAVVGWIPLATAADATAVWSPDGSHIAVSMANPGAPPEGQSVSILGRDGSIQTRFEQVIDPVWIDGRSFIVYRPDWRQDESGEWYAETGPDGERLGQVWQGTIDSSALTEIALPLGPAISNGHGALAVGGFDEAGEAQTAIWTAGGASDWRPGRAAGWSSDGSRLALIRAARSDRSDEGWIEILEWPSMTALWTSDESVRVGDVLFDPTGEFIAYPEFTELPTPPRQVPQFELTVRIVELETGEVGGVTAQENGQFAWTEGGAIAVVGFDSARLITYDRDGLVLAEAQVIGPSVMGSADGSTLLFYDRELDAPQMQVTTGQEPWTLESPGTMAGQAPALAADGSGLLVVVRMPSNAPGGPPATVLLHQL